MKVEVVVEKFGTYSKGDTIEMDNTTAAAIIKQGLVKEYESESKTKKEVKK